MDKLSYKSQKMISNLIYSTLVFTLVYLFGLAINLEIEMFTKIFIVVIGSAIVKFFLFNPLILYILLLISLIALILVHRYITPILFVLGDRVYYLFDNIIDNLKGKENISTDNILLFWIILVVLVSFFTAIALFKRKKVLLLLTVYISFFLYYWYILYDEAYWMISIFFLAFFILMGLYKYFNEVEIERLYTPWLKTVTLYSVLIVFLALLLPKNNNYIQWPWLQQKVYTHFPFIEELRSYDSYSRTSGEATLFNFGITGYQGDSSRLGGPVILSEKKIMTVQADDICYLRGIAKQTYTGNSWKALDEPPEEYSFRKDFSALSLEDKETYYSEIDITITNHSFASTTIFSPYKPTKFSFKGSDSIYVYRDDILCLPNGVYDGESYIIRAHKPLPYGMLVSLGVDRKKTDISKYKLYLQLPVDRITERTKILVNSLIKDANNDFEKAIAIENYLRNNYKYNLNVEEVPEDMEFVDYFLFEEREGYCTYYATSLAIMLRLAGIPTRYIEGYLAQDSEEPGIYEVRLKNAHAWVEAFIEPVGWMTFEPTPSYPIQPRLEDYKPSELDEDVNSNEHDKIIKEPKRNLDDLIIEENNNNILDNEKTPDMDKLNKDSSGNLPKNTSYILIAILLILPIRFLIRFLRYRYGEYKAKKLPNNKRVIYLYNEILKIMELFGYPQQYGETHYEYANRTANKFYYQDEKGIKEITAIFVRSKYSNISTSGEDVLELEKYRKIIEKHLRSFWGIRTYYYRKYIK